MSPPATKFSPGDSKFIAENFETCEGKFLVSPEDGGDKGNLGRSCAAGGGINSGGAGKFAMEYGDTGLILLFGLKFNTIEGLLDK